MKLMVITRPFPQKALVGGLLVLLAWTGEAAAQANHAVPPPRPLLPIPTARQLDWQHDELRLFIHFGTGTFTDREGGTGNEDPAIFNWPVESLRAGIDARSGRRLGLRRAARRHIHCAGERVRARKPAHAGVRAGVALRRDGQFGAYCIQPGFNYAVYDRAAGNRLIDAASRL